MLERLSIPGYLLQANFFKKVCKKMALKCVYISEGGENAMGADNQQERPNERKLDLNRLLSLLESSETVRRMPKGKRYSPSCMAICRG